MHQKFAAMCIVSAMLGASSAFASEPPRTSAPPANVEMRAPSTESPTPSRPSTPTPASSADKAKYAAKEAASADAKNYKGGDDVVIISAGTTAVVLAVILLVVLL
jgi:hypothetical protein